MQSTCSACGRPGHTVVGCGPSAQGALTDDELREVEYSATVGLTSPKMVARLAADLRTLRAELERVTTQLALRDQACRLGGDEVKRFRATVAAVRVEIDDIEQGGMATASRDYGRGTANAARQIRSVLDRSLSATLDSA